MTSSIRHDWYQTDEKVVITALIKNAKNYDVQIESDLVHIKADEYQLDVNLYAGINKERSTYRIVPVKVEVTLYKLVGERWPSLERPANEVIVVPDKVVTIYKQWDSLEKQIEKEEEEKPEVNYIFNNFWIFNF